MNEIARKIGDQTCEVLSGLYPDIVVGGVGNIAEVYISSKMEKNPGYIAMPPSLIKAAGGLEKISNPIVCYENKGLPEDLFKGLGIYDGKVIHGPLNHIIARMITIPRMLNGYIDNYPETDEEREIYTDPPILQRSLEDTEDLKGIKHIHYDFFAGADENLQNQEELMRRFRMLGALGQDISEFEFAYPAIGSTQAYENFGIFHLFPDNIEVDITSTTPGIILPTEADPLRFKDSVQILKKNLLRPTYFEMLRHSIDLGEERVRKYSANKIGTAENLKKYGHLDDAKNILQGYIDLGKRFEIALGEQDERMKLATLVGDIGIVFSVRDKKQKSKIAHNVTVTDSRLVSKYRDIFDEQFEEGKLITDTGTLDELMKMNLGG